MKIKFLNLLSNHALTASPLATSPAVKVWFDRKKIQESLNQGAKLFRVNTPNISLFPMSMKCNLDQIVLINMSIFPNLMSIYFIQKVLEA